MKAKKQKLQPFFILAVLVFISLLSYTIYKVGGAIGNTHNISTSLSEIKDWSTYSNKTYQYSFKHPEDVVLSYTVPGFGIDVPNEETKKFDIRFTDLDEEYVHVSAIDYFAPRINMNQWEKINAKINGVKVEAYKNKKVEVDEDKLLFRFKNEAKEIQVDFILTYKEKATILDEFYNIISSFQFED